MTALQKEMRDKAMYARKYMEARDEVEKLQKKVKELEEKLKKVA